MMTRMPKPQLVARQQQKRHQASSFRAKLLCGGIYASATVMLWSTHHLFGIDDTGSRSNVDLDIIQFTARHNVSDTSGAQQKQQQRQQQQFPAEDLPIVVHHGGAQKANNDLEFVVNPVTNKGLPISNKDRKHENDDDQEAPSVIHHFTKDVEWPFDSAKQVKLYLVHVGKAGGKSLYDPLYVRASLTDRLKCRMYNTTGKPNDDHCFVPKYSNAGRPIKTFDSMISQRLYGHLHLVSPRYTPVQQKWLRLYTNLLLVTVRDPVDRIVSAFNYHRFEYFGNEEPKPRQEYAKRDQGPVIYMDCFATVEDLAKSLQANSAAHPFCQRLARDLTQGDFIPTPCVHFHWNYQYYGETAWPDRSKPVVVVRTESMWQDVARIESLLGGDPQQFLDLDGHIKITHGSESFQLTSGLSQESTLVTCCALRREMQVYHDLVVAALNLKADEKVETLRRLFNHCGINDELAPIEIASWRWRNWYRQRCAGVLWWT